MKRLILLFCLCGLLAGCGNPAAGTTPTNIPSASSVTSSLPQTESEENTLSTEGSSLPSAPSASSAGTEKAESPVPSNSPSLSASTPNPPQSNGLISSVPNTPDLSQPLHITKGGTYSLTGEKKDVMITVDAGEEVVTLTLAGITVTNTKGPALYIASAKQVNLILAKGTQNILSDGNSYSLSDQNGTLDAALFSRSDLHISGEGSLTVQGNCKHGIVSKDDLILSGGTYQVTAKNVALEGKDCVKINDGQFTLSAGTDGIRASNAENPAKGYIDIQKGTLVVTAGSDGIQAATNLTVAGGEITLTAGMSGVQAEGTYRQTGGKVVLFGMAGSGKRVFNVNTAAIAQGGTLLAFGDGAKAKHLTSVTKGCAILVPLPTQKGSTPFVLKKQGVTLVEITPPKAYSMALVYSSTLTTGEYTLTVGTKTQPITVSQSLST